MINKICGNYARPANNKALTPSQNKPSFGMAYHLDSSLWNKTFDNINEQSFISKIIEKAKHGNLSYLNSNGSTYRFKTEDGEIIYGRETRGLMSSLKFIPNNRSNTGFYMIDNSTNADTSRIYKSMTGILDGIISSHKKKAGNTYNPQNIVTSTLNNLGADKKPYGLEQSAYLRDTTPRGMRAIQLQEKSQRAAWPSENKTKSKINSFWV